MALGRTDQVAGRVGRIGGSVRGGGRRGRESAEGKALFAVVRNDGLEFCEGDR